MENVRSWENFLIGKTRHLEREERLRGREPFRLRKKDEDAVERNLFQFDRFEVHHLEVTPAGLRRHEGRRPYVKLTRNWRNSGRPNGIIG